MKAARECRAKVQLVGDWEAFVQDVVASPPDACVLHEPTLSTGGDGGLLAADMTLRALGFPTVIALDSEDPQLRFQIEMETEFTHFVTAPFTAEELSAAINATAPRATPLRVRSASNSVSSHQQRIRPGALQSESVSGVKLSPTQRDAPPFGHSVTDHLDTRPLEATAQADATRPTKSAATSSGAFFGPAVGPVQLEEMTSRETTQSEAVSEDMVTHDDDDALLSLDEFIAQHREGDAGQRGWSRDSVTAVADAEVHAQNMQEVPSADHPATPSAPSAPSQSATDFFFEQGPSPSEDSEARTAPTRSSDMAFRELDALLPELDALQADRAGADVETANVIAEFEISNTDLHQKFRASAVDNEHPISESGAAWRVRSGTGTQKKELSGSGIFKRSRTRTGSFAKAASSADDEPAAAPRAPAVPVSPSASGATPISSSVEPESQPIDVRAVSGASARVASVSQATGALFTVPLPDPNGGDLSQVSVPHIIYTYGVVEATGELTLRTGSLQRTVAFFKGRAGTVHDVPTADDERKFLSTFGWLTGSYEFTARDVPEPQFHPFGEPMQFIYRGVQRHFGLNETATALGPYLKQYIVATDQGARFQRILGLEGVGEFIRAAKGDKTLEQMMASGGVDTESLLRRAYFSWLTGSVICTDHPVEAPLHVQFEVQEIVSPNAPKSAPRKTVTLSPENSAPPTPQDNEDAHRQTFERLGHQWNILSSRDAYEVFQLTPGCGVEAVNRKFYNMVREYHPDRYARIQNAQIRTLAEKVFVQIRNLHTELLAMERSGTKPNRRQSVSGPRTPENTPNPPPTANSRRRSARGRVPSGQPNATVRPDSSVSGQRRTPRPTSGGSARTRVSSDQHATAVAGTEVGQPRKVSDVLERLRARGTTGEQASLSASVRKLKPDQLVRNAKAATEQGNFEKAHELIELAKARGASGVVIEAYATFLAYTQDTTLADTTISTLTDKVESVEEGKNIDKSHIWMLAGHTSRLEEDTAAAIKSYERAVRAWADNESASRWLRHLRRRQADEKKKPFSSSILTKLFNSNKSK